MNTSVEISERDPKTQVFENFANQFVRDPEKVARDREAFTKYFNSRIPVEIQAGELVANSADASVNRDSEHLSCEENPGDEPSENSSSRNSQKPDPAVLEFQKKLEALKFKGGDDLPSPNFVMEMTGGDSFVPRPLKTDLFLKEIGLDTKEGYFRDPNRNPFMRTAEPGMDNYYQKLVDSAPQAFPSRMQAPLPDILKSLQDPKPKVLKSPRSFENFPSLAEAVKSTVEEDDTPGADQPDIVEEDEPYEESEESMSSDEEDIEAEKKKPIVVNLKKGFSADQIKTFVAGFDALLKDRSPESVTISTEEWLAPGEVRRFPLIPAAKKLFARFSEAGLLACLVSRGQNRAAAEVFCISYCKAKQDKEGNVTFGKIDVEDFAERVIASEKKLSEATNRSVNFRKEGSKIIATPK